MRFSPKGVIVFAAFAVLMTAAAAAPALGMIAVAAAVTVELISWLGPLGLGRRSRSDRH